MDFSSKQKIKCDNIIFGNMPAKPNACAVLQCRQINFKGEGTKYFKKRDLYYYHYYFCNYYHSIIIIVVATDNDDKITKNFLGCRQKSFYIRHLCFHLSTLFRVLPTLRTYWNVLIAWQCLQFLLGCPNQKNRIFILICLRHLNKKLHKLSSAWNPLVLPCPLDKILIICPNSIFKVSFLFHCHLLRQHSRFFYNQVYRHTQKLYGCVPHKFRCTSFL